MPKPEMYLSSKIILFSFKSCMVNDINLHKTVTLDNVIIKKHNKEIQTTHM